MLLEPEADATTLPEDELLDTVTFAESVVDAKIMFASVAGLVVPVRIPVRVKESDWFTLDQFAVMSTVAVSPVLMLASPEAVEPVPAAIVNVAFAIVALLGPDARTPNPRAATTASAIRLKVVLLDICFLSIVVTETFSVAALR